MQVLSRLFKLLPWVDLGIFYAKVKFAYIGFCISKSKNYLETVAAIGLKVGLNIQINELMRLNEHQRQVHYLTLAKGHSVLKLNLVFLRNY